jgi:AcrR family transcriptional regulator
MDRSKPVEAPVWLRAERRRRPALTREAIVAAALKIADEEGLEAVSIRRVAAELCARAMSIYSHIDRKEDLINLMADEVSGEILIKDEIPADWREALTKIAHLTRETMIRHPWIIHMAGKRTEYGPNALRHIEQSLTAVDGLNTDTNTAVQVIAAVDHFVLGCVRREIMDKMSREQHGMTHGERLMTMLDYLRGQAQENGLTRLAHVLEEKVPKSWNVGFDRGLSWLLDGIERDLVKD